MPSMNASTTGLRVIRHILAMDPKAAGHELSEIQPLMTLPEDQKVFEFVRGHLATYGNLPHPDTVLDKTSSFLPEIQESYAFERKQLQNRFVEEAIRDASDKASMFLQEGKVMDALGALVGDLLPVTQGQSGYTLADLRHTKVLDVYADKIAHPEKYAAKSFFWPSLDDQGGIEDGDMVGLVGRPGSGKTWLMLRHSASYWGAHQEPVIFVTQEMSAEQLENRLLPMIAGVNPTPLYKGKPIQYEIGGLDQKQYVEKLEEARALVNSAKSPFLIYDSKMAGTVQDIESIASMHGARRVWIDGAYMIRHTDPRLNRYQRVPENLDMMKYWCQRTGVAITSSWQFKRGAGKDDAGETPDLDDIGYSHAIGEYMGIVIGLLENPKSVSQMNKKHITIMKGRNGEQGGFNVWWDFKNMIFDEITAQESDTDLTYL